MKIRIISTDVDLISQGQVLHCDLMICRPAPAAAAAAALYLVFGRCFRLPVGCWMKLFAQSLAGPSVGQGKRGGCWGTRTKDTVVDKIWECCHVKMVGIGLAFARKIAPAFAVVSSKRRRRCRCLTRLDFDICFSSLWLLFLSLSFSVDQGFPYKFHTLFLPPRYLFIVCSFLFVQFLRFAVITLLCCFVFAFFCCFVWCLY